MVSIFKREKEEKIKIQVYKMGRNNTLRCFTVLLCDIILHILGIPP